MRQTVIACRNFDWVGLRQAFIERPERATYAELGREFHLSEDRIKRCACDEGWATLRAAHLDKQLRSGDAAVALMRAAKMDSAIMASFTNLALETVRKLQEIVDQVESKKSVNTRANTLNTVSFAMGNIARALKEVGVVGIPKALKESAGVDSGNGRWNPAMLQSLNITVANLMQPSAPAASQEAVSVVQGDESP